MTATETEYKEVYGYTKDELEQKYSEMIEEAKGNPDKIANIDISHTFSALYDTPLSTHINNLKIQKLISDYILNEESTSYDKYQSLGYSEREINPEKQRKLSNAFSDYDYYYRVINKKCSDWLIRQKEVIKLIQGAIIKLVESDYSLGDQGSEEIYSDLIDAINRYKESQLDLITMKASEELLPMFEIRLFLNKYSEDLKALMERWNKHNGIYASLNGSAIGYYKTDNLNIADQLYQTKYDLLKKDFNKYINGYSGLFLDDETLLEIVFIKGECINGR